LYFFSARKNETQDIAIKSKTQIFQNINQKVLEKFKKSIEKIFKSV